MSQAVHGYWVATTGPLAGRPIAANVWCPPPHATSAADSHRPDAPVDRRSGVVLCPPFGYEAICARATLNVLGRELANHGHHVCLLDYDGTGDSCGDDSEPNRVASWIASIELAADGLRQTHGVTQLALVGVRLGALLAANAVVATRASGLVAVAPVASGKAYLRELKALQQALGLAPASERSPRAGAGGADGTDGADDARQALGFLITAATEQELAQLAMRPEDGQRFAAALPPGFAFHLLDRRDLPSGAKWLTAWQPHVAHASAALFDGYPQMVADPHKAEVPAGLTQAIATWLADHVSDEALGDAALRGAAPASGVEVTWQTEVTYQAVNERCVTLHAGATPLRGIVTAPANRKAEQALLLLNAGGVRRIGPNRMWVQLARLLAARGIASLRFDIAGLGDSPHAAAAMPAGRVDVYPATAVSDVRRALGFMRQTYPTVAALGLCAGGYHAFKAALQGGLASVIVINPLTFFWQPGMSLDISPAQTRNETKAYGESFRSIEKWQKLLRGDVNVRHVAKVFRRRLLERGEHAMREVGRRVGLKLGDDLGFELAQLAALGTKQHFIFAADDPGYGMLREQGGSAVARLQQRGALSLVTIANADHTFTARWAQAALLEEILKHVGEAR